MYSAAETMAAGGVFSGRAEWKDVPGFRVRTVLHDGRVVWFSNRLQSRAWQRVTQYREREETAEEFWGKQW